MLQLRRIAGYFHNERAERLVPDVVDFAMEDVRLHRNMLEHFIDNGLLRGFVAEQHLDDAAVRIALVPQLAGQLEFERVLHEFSGQRLLRVGE